MSAFVKQLENIDKREFYSQNIFHERQMNSCPIGCQGCAVSASTSAKGSMVYDDLFNFYQDAKNHDSQLRITKVEGYDPVFVNYADNKDLPFARSIQDAVDLGHQIITPVCTTGSWKTDRTKWQLEELGKLSNKYRYFQYPSGNEGVGFVLSVPREIRPYADGRYNYDEHLEKIIEDIHLLTINGDLEVLVYYNNLRDSDYDTAVMIKSNVAVRLSERARRYTKFTITNFNSETIPESCYRYNNSILVANSGFYKINAKTMNWDDEPPMFANQQEIAKKLVAAKAS